MTGPYVGPRGGKWADAKHTIPWKEKKVDTRKTQKLTDVAKTQIIHDGHTYNVTAGWDEADRNLVDVREGGRRITLTEYSLGPGEGPGKLGIPADAGKRYGAYVAIEKWLRRVYDEEGKLRGEMSKAQVDEELAELLKSKGLIVGKQQSEEYVQEVEQALEDHRGDQEGLEGLNEYLGKGYVGEKWEMQFYGTPHEVAALECQKKEVEHNKAYRVWRDGGKPYSEKTKMGRVARAKYEEQRDREEKKYENQGEEVAVARIALEATLLDWKIEEAKRRQQQSMGKSENSLEKAGPYIGPKGGKWADSRHTIPWKEGAVTKKPEGHPSEMDEKSAISVVARAAVDIKDKKIRDEVRQDKNGKWRAKAKEFYRQALRAPEARSASMQKIEDEIAAVLTSHIMRRHIRGEAAKKSMEGINDMSEYLEKADGGLPTHAPKMGGEYSATQGGSAEGGAMEGVGKTSGKSDSAPGDSIEELTPKDQVLSKDDEEDENMGAKPPVPESLDYSKSLAMTPATQREMVAHEQAKVVSRLKKGQEDLHVHPYSEVGIHANGDEYASELAKSEGFYHGRSPATSRPLAIIDRSVLCKACDTQYTAALTACPGCGCGTTSHRVAPGTHMTTDGGIRLEKAQPRLRRPKGEEDVHFEVTPVRISRY